MPVYCLHPDCLTEVECFPSEGALESHHLSIHTIRSKTHASSTEYPAVTPAEGDGSTYQRGIAALKTANVPFSHLGPHPPVRTSEEAMLARIAEGWTDTTLAQGAKAMLLTHSKTGAHTLLVLSAASKLDWKKVRKVVAGGKANKMATEEEVVAATGCLPGAVPPFGSWFVPPIPTIVDPSLGRNAAINFNCGLRTRSLCLAYSDYVRFEKPQQCDIASES